MITEEAVDGQPTFRWLTPPTEFLTLVSGRCVTLDLPHDQAFHAEIIDDPRRFCGQVALNSSLDLSGNRVELEWVAAPYCRARAGISESRTLGWNFVLTVDDGNQAVVAFRHPSLAGGGRWHLSANEGAEPQDIAFADERLGLLHVGRIAARALYEELGLVVDDDRLQEVVEVRGVFEADSGIGVFIHVPGERFGITAAASLRT
jgi:hypothetical protein